MKELCQLCGTRVRLSEVKHVSVTFTLLRCYTFMLKKPFTFSLSKNNNNNNNKTNLKNRQQQQQLNFLSASSDVFLSLFLSLRVFSFYVWTKFSRDAAGRTSPPNVVETMTDSPESHTCITTKRMYPGLSYQFMRLARVVVLYTST